MTEMKLIFSIVTFQNDNVLFYMADWQVEIVINCCVTEVLSSVVKLLKDVANCKSFVPSKVYCNCELGCSLFEQRELSLQQTWTLDFCILWTVDRYHTYTKFIIWDSLTLAPFWFTLNLNRNCVVDRQTAVLYFLSGF